MIKRLKGAMLVLLILCLQTAARAELNMMEMQTCLMQCSEDELLLLREWIDAELQQRGYIEKEEQEYILNTNTCKFHLPSCSSVKKMKESNKKSFTGDRDDVLSLGYSPCGNCNP